MRQVIKTRVLLTLALLGFAAGVCAQQPAANQVEPPPSAAAIATRTGDTENADIAARIGAIFSEIEPLRSVKIKVSAGVVTLAGTVPSAPDIDRAEAIASRVAGVVTVENKLSRDLKVTTNLTPALSQFDSDVRGLAQALPLLGVALMIGLVIAAGGYGLASIGTLWRAVTPNPFLAELAATFVRFVFIIFGMVAALEVLGATALLGGVLGGAGVIGIALGFAVRDTVDNYVSSIMLSLRQPFRANDHVVIEGHEGRVVRLTSRATILMTLDGNQLRIPNSIVFKSVILNFTRNAERRFFFDLGIDADDDPITGMEVGLGAVNALPFVLNTPKATAVIENFGDSNVVLRFFGWVDQAETDFMKGRSLAIDAAAQALTSGGFKLPEPIYRLRFDDNAPLPIKRPAPDQHAQDASPRRLSPTPPVAADTSPDTHVKQMVIDERSSPNDNDLLDSRRPVE